MFSGPGFEPRRLQVKWLNVYGLMGNLESTFDFRCPLLLAQLEKLPVRVSPSQEAL